MAHEYVEAAKKDCRDGEVEAAIAKCDKGKKILISELFALSPS